MLTVSNDVKAKLKSDICRKELRITVGSTVCTNSDIYNDSFELTESIMDSKVEFVGCISSILKATISTTKLPKANLQGQTVEAEVAVYLDDNTLSAYIPLFHGYVDSCETSADGYWQNLVCYDCLAYLTDTPIYNAYKKAFNGGSITLAAFRSAIFTAIGIGQEIQTLPNDAIKFRKRYRNKDLTALALIRHITQINGAFGIINRDEYFEYKYIDDSAAPEDIPYYRSLEYANTTITPINTGGLTIRTNPNDAGVTVDWTNYQQYAGTDPDWNDETQDDYLVDDDDEDISEGNYVIEGNLIAYKLKKSKKQVIAANIMDAIGHDAVFRQYKVVCNGLPYIECGDKVRFTKADSSQIGFVVFKRTLKGVQAMTDTYECMPSQEVVTNVDTSGGSGGITPQTVNNDASYVSNIAATTQSMGPDNALLGLIEKNITANGTYAANDDGAEGYSEVKVNVPGGGTNIHYIGEVQAMAVENISAGDCVYVTRTPSGSATLVQTSISGNSSAGFATDSDYVYFVNGTSIYRLPFNNLSGTPELYISDLYRSWAVALARKYIVYREANSTISHFLMAGGSELNSFVLNTWLFYYATQSYNVFDSKWYSLRTGSENNYQAGRPPGGDRCVLLSETEYVSRFDHNTESEIRTYREGSLILQQLVNVKIYTTYWMTFGTYLVGYSDPGYTLGYVDLKGGATLTWHPIYDQNGNTISSSAAPSVYPQFNDTEEFLVFSLGNNGIALVDSDMSAVVYSNITNIQNYSQMLGNYFFKTPREVYYLGLTYTMGKTNAKTHAGSLGYVDTDVESSATGTAYILFS